MEHLISPNQIIEEISLIPDDKMTELYDLIHNFKMFSNQSENNINQIMHFAGCWENMSDQDFTDFCGDMEQRRQTHHGDLPMKPCLLDSDKNRCKSTH